MTLSFFYRPVLSNILAKTSPGWRTMLLTAILIGYSVVNIVGTFGYLAPIAAVVGSAIVILMVLSTEFALGLLMCSVVLFQSEQLFQWSIPLFGGGLKIPDVVLGLAFAGSSMRILLLEWRNNGVSSADRSARTFKVVLFAFIAWAFLSALLGIRSGLPYKDSLLELRPLMQYVWFFLILSELRRQNLERVLVATFSMCLLISLEGLWLFATGQGEVGTFNGGFVRIMSVEFSYILFCCIMSATMYLGSTRHRMLSLFAMAASFSALVVTFQRSAFIGLAIGLLFVFFWLGSHALEHVLWSGLTLLLLAALVLPVIWVAKPDVFRPLIALEQRLASVGEYQADDSAQHRFREWRASVEMIRARPLAGHGLGTRVIFFSPQYEREGTKKGFWSHDIYIHNSYVWITVKMGLIGLLLLLTMVGLIFWRGVGFLRAGSDHSYDRVLVIGLLACLAALVTISFFGPMITSPTLTPFVALVAGAIWIISRDAESCVPRTTVRPWLRSASDPYYAPASV